MKLFLPTSATSILLCAAVPCVSSLELRGSSPAVAKSVETFREVPDTTSAVVVGVYPPEDECWDYEETSGTQKDLDTWCFRAHQQCCSSNKKYNNWKLFCQFYAFDPEPDETSKGIAVYTTFSPEDPIDCNQCHDKKCTDDDDVVTIESSMDLRGSSSVVAKSVEGLHEVPDAASAVVIGVYPPEDECWDYEETQGTQKDLNTWCFRAHEQCCSSYELYQNWKLFCKFYAFEPEPDETSKGVAGYLTFDPEDPIDCNQCHDKKCTADDDVVTIEE